MEKYLIDVLIEIPFGSNVKYEYDNDYKCVRCNRIMSTSLVYPTNYGFVPNTEAGDGDPLDVLLISDYQLYPNTVIEAKIVGVLLTEDEEGEDNKILAVPSNKVDPRYKDINNYTEIDTFMLDKIIHFYNNYKKLEKDRWINVKDYKDRDVALKIYLDSILNDEPKDCDELDGEGLNVEDIKNVDITDIGIAVEENLPTDIGINIEKLTTETRNLDIEEI